MSHDPRPTPPLTPDPGARGVVFTPEQRAKIRELFHPGSPLRFFFDYELGNGRHLELHFLLSHFRRRFDAFHTLLEAYMSELHDAFLALETGLSALEADEATAEASIAADDAQIVDLRSQIADLEAKLAAAQAAGSASDLTPAEINDATQRLGSMRARLHALLNPSAPPEVSTPPAQTPVTPATPPADTAPASLAPGVGVTSEAGAEVPPGEPASTEQTPVGQG